MCIKKPPCRGLISLFLFFHLILVHIAILVGALQAFSEAVVLASQFVVAYRDGHGERQLCLFRHLVQLFVDVADELFRNFLVI